MIVIVMLRQLEEEVRERGELEVLEEVELSEEVEVVEEEGELCQKETSV